jgi:hypothetical protein
MKAPQTRRIACNQLGGEYAGALHGHTEVAA